MNEFEVIGRYFRSSTGALAKPNDAGINTGIDAMADSGIETGIGDDCALLRVPDGHRLAVSVDTLVADVHFPASAEPALIAQRALCVSLSDLAAMGAKPLWITLCLTLPEVDESWIGPFSCALHETAARYNCALVGGDTTRGPLALSVQVMGSVPIGKGLLRSGAGIGDQVYVTGTLGDGAAGLAAVQQHLQSSENDITYLKQRFFHPEPQFKAGAQLLSFASAAIDISDGLLADLGHICTASGVRAVVEIDQLPLSAALKRSVDVEQQRLWALSGGDDYQLCFTVPAAHIAAIEALIADSVLDAQRIGEICAGEGVVCRLQQQPFDIAHKGYNHFG